MFSLDILCAVLQGLPAKYLDFLDPPWGYVCTHIELGLKDGLDPMAALNYALGRMSDLAKDSLKKALLKTRLVMQMPGLSYRQKEALIALRVAGVASLAQLSRVPSSPQSGSLGAGSALGSQQ